MSKRGGAVAVWFSGALLFGQFYSPGMQQQPTSSARHSATGVVVNSVTGEPLRKALVTLQTADGQSAAFTDAAGHFSIDNVPDGQYGVQCRKPGFYSPEQRAGSNWTPGPEVTVSAAAQPITIKLAPAASITGRVLDDQGLAVENAGIELSLLVIENGRKRWMTQRSVNTDEDGNYEISNLQPGTYRLRFNMHQGSPFAAGMSQTGQSQVAQSRIRGVVYPAQYYPQAPDESSAQPIMLSAGQTQQADFSVKGVPAYRVQGTVTPVSMGTFIRLEDSAGFNPGAWSVNWRTGRWTIPALPSGTWHLIAQSFQEQRQLRGEQTVTVNGSDIANVRIELGSETDATIPINVANSETGNLNVQLRLVSDSNSHEGPGWQQNDYYAQMPNPRPEGTDPPKPNGLQFTNVAPGHYHLIAQSFGPGSCLDSVQFGGNDVRRNGVQVAAGGISAPLDVSLRTDCASVEVKVNAPEDAKQDAKQIAILLLPDDPVLEVPVVNSSGGGTASFPSLPPGGYRVYAFDNIDQLEYANPEVMKQFTAEELTLAPNQKAQVTLPLISRAGDRSTADAPQ